MPKSPKALVTPALSPIPSLVVMPAPVMDALVRLYPVPGAYITGEPAIEREVTREEADRLLAYKPPAYTTEAPPPSEAEDDLPEAITPDEPQE